MWIVMVAMLAYLFDSTASERREQCRTTIEVRASNERSDIALVDDIAAAVVDVTDVEVSDELLDTIKGRVAERISARYDALPPPASC